MVGNVKMFIGRTVYYIKVGEHEESMVFETDQGDITVAVQGHCCSESWFADFTGVDALIGYVVLKAEEVDLPGYNTDDGRGRQESDSVYGYRFTTPRGQADLIFRNSSNGYYGGWAEFFAGKSSAQGRPITGDWAA